VESKKTFFISITLSFVVATLIVLLSGGEFLARLELLTSDIYFRLRGPLQSRQPIMIVEVTDNDVAKIGRWPWKRSWHAAMTKVLTDLGAEAVYFDIIFSEPSDEENDKLFEESIKLSGNVYLPYVFPSRPYDIDDALLPIKRFSENVKGMGGMNVYPDDDGTIRRIPLLFTGESGTYPHITLKLFMDMRGYKIKHIGEKELMLSSGKDHLSIPLVGDNSLTINWKGKWTESFKHFSFIDILAGYQNLLEGRDPGFDPDDFKDAVCLVGITGFGLYDIKPIPLEPEYPGVGIIANTIYTLLEKKFIYVVPRWLNLLVIYVMTLLPAFLIMGEKPFRETAIVFLAAVLYFAVSFYLFMRGIRINLFFPLAGLISSFITVGTYNFVRTAVAKQSLFNISITDGLTGLCNVRYFKVLLETQIKMAKSGMSKGFAVVLSDIDHFKSFNDTYGHQVGDLVLQEVASTMKSAVRATDVVARYGGEEIITLVKNVSLKLALHVTEKMRASLDENKFSDGKNTYHVTSSFGVATYQPEDTVDSIIKRADEALYKSKEAGRNCVNTLEEVTDNTPVEAPEDGEDNTVAGSQE